MSKLKLDKIDFSESSFVIEVKNEKVKREKVELEAKVEQEKKLQEDIVLQKKIEEENKKKIDEAQLILNRAKDEAQAIVDKAKMEAQEILEKANSEIEQNKAIIIEDAKNRADEIVNTASESSKAESERLLNESKEKIEQERIKVTKDGYEDGYKDGLEKIQEELEEKIASFDTFCKYQYEIRQKVLKSASKDVLSLILNISRKILLKEVDALSLEKIIKQTISLLDKKENVSIILSEKYARLLFELQQKKLADEEELNFDEFKQYDGFDVIYNPKLDDDTIIVENLKERFDASINSQLDIVIRNIFENSQNGQIELEEYIEDETERTE